MNQSLRKIFGTLFLIVTFKVGLSATELLPYSSVQKDHYFFAYNKDVLAIHDSNDSGFSRDQVMLGANWKNVTYRLKAYYAKDAETYFFNDFFWDALSIQVPYLKSHIQYQLAIMNIGAPRFDYDGLFVEKFRNSGNISMAYETRLRRHNFLNDAFLKHLVLTQRFQFFRNIPSYFYYSIFNTKADQSVFRSAYGLSYELPNRKLLLEYDPESEIMLIGLSIGLSDSLTLKTQYNTLGNAYVFDAKDSPEKMFFPEFSFGLSFEMPMFKKKKSLAEKARLAKQIDEETLSNLEKGLIAYYDQDYDRALKHYLIVVKRDPYFALGHIRLGDIYYQLDLFEKAKLSWKKALYLDPGNPKAILGLQKIEEIKLQQGN